jgi:hypothetical protein
MLYYFAEDFHTSVREMTDELVMHRTTNITHTLAQRVQVFETNIADKARGLAKLSKPIFTAEPFETSQNPVIEVEEEELDEELGDFGNQQDIET